MENISKDFKNYSQTLSEYNDYLKELIKKYDIKPPAGNVVKRLAFNINIDYDNSSNLKQQQHFKFITSVVDFRLFPDA